MRIDKNPMPLGVVVAGDVRAAPMDYDYLDTPIGSLLLVADERRKVGLLLLRQLLGEARHDPARLAQL